eukprot:3087898-Lingulodinium_polyedra.AAC.1
METLRRARPTSSSASSTAAPSGASSGAALSSRPAGPFPNRLDLEQAKTFMPDLANHPANCT